MTDVLLPGNITGEAIAEQAQAAGVGCVLMTGYGDVMSKLGKQHCIWLRKPFRSTELARAILDEALQSVRGNTP